MQTALDARILDKNAEEIGINMEDLMDNAGSAVANLVKSLHPKSVFIASGSGNNGGDGYAAGINLLKEGFAVEAYPLSAPSTVLCKKKHERFLKAGGKVVKSFVNGKYDVVVDALLGVGISGDLREPYLSFIDLLNNSGSKIVSVDIPSGFPSKTAIKPLYTVTMQFRKEEMSKENSGNIIIADVGFTKDATEMIGPGDLLALPSSEQSSHKGDNGICVLIGGSREFFGAPLYMAKSALRMGPDLVILFSPRDIHGYIASNTQDIIMRKSGTAHIELTYELMKYIRKRADSVGIGPGISKDANGLEEASKIIDLTISANRKIVIDADALTAAKNVDNFKGNAVLTPHRGEFRSVFGLEPSEENVMKVAAGLNAVIFLKGEVDIVTDGTFLKKNKSYHHQSMTRGGTGDLVTGAIAGLLARRVDPVHSAFLASYIIGKAGLTAFNAKGYSYLTSEIVEHIPDVVNPSANKHY